MNRRQKIQQSLRLAGPTGLALHSFDWAMNRWSSWHVHKCIELTEARVEPLSKLECRRLTAEEAGDLLTPLVEVVDEAFIEDVCRKQDDCYVAFEGEIPVAFRWFSKKSTLFNPDWRVDIPDGTIYSYNGFTFPEFRGKRLDGRLTSRALEDYQQEGYRSILGLIGHTNFPMVRSNARLGCQFIGTVVMWNVGSWSWAYVSRSLLDNEIRVSATGEHPSELD